MRTHRLTVLGLLAVTVGTAVASVLVPAGPAAALSCVMPAEVVADAPQVVSGRIVDGGGSKILVAVDSVWKGGPVAERVWLHVNEVGWTEWVDGDEIPDGYRSAGQWVFAIDDAHVGACTAWRADDVEDLAPDVTEPPVRDGVVYGKEDVAAPRHARTPAVLAAGTGAAGLAALVGVLLLWRRRSSVRG